ncbi:DEAD/DEAH box helicase [Rehaibacterium terrae]|jgi:ATP-dependent RNA helicase RhlE|uniref:DEAD-box ATP-dependent RNA helicase RhpA n=1 Tax=Rehaibacterium terrae TaxID=1341696 RepID=A0A7W8DDS7_9GAMM|nr:DEAD/DEAH box helicase [Rehaibacterium terrae]MBB5015316.1 ATP-dependent RNA helicase RhlE [Rehaibacterium terrae]
MSFDTLGLSPALLRALAEHDYTTPTPIQAAAIPLALAGHDLLAGAQTGTGKTAAFGLPLLQRLTDSAADARGPRRPRALILAPTRELALQVHDSLRAYARHLRLSLTAIYGGAGMKPQLDALRRGVDVLVATPGRLIDHLDRRSVDLTQVEVLVLDEADRMLDMGFLPAIRRILGTLPKSRQTLLFSATFEANVKQLAREFMREPQEVMVAPNNTIAETITHRVHPVDAGRKRELLLHLLAQDSRRQTLVFSRTKHGADRLAEQIERSGIRAVAIHGNKSQGARLRALKDFKSGRATVMVATDIAARGLDIDQLPVVINFDLPMVAEDYVHRIGRTGRAGAQGEAISLVASAEVALLRAITRLLKKDIELAEVDGYAPAQPLRLDAPAPRAGNPRAGRPAHNARRGHPGTPRHAHAGPKKHGHGPRDARGGERRERNARPY